MQDDKAREQGSHAEEDEQVICSNKLLAMIREKMAKERERGKKHPEKLNLEEPE
jgi:hypothetical protein